MTLAISGLCTLKMLHTRYDKDKTKVHEKKMIAHDVNPKQWAT